MRIAIIGRGRVGAVLGPAFAEAGHEVAFGLRDPRDPRHAGADGVARMGTREAAEWAEVVVLAVNWPNVDQALADCGPMDGRILIDCTNPLNFSPEDGLTLAFGFDRSAGEHVAAATRARVVKTLNHVGAAVMGAAKGYARPPVQFVAGDDGEAKTIVSGLLVDLGFRPVDFGGIANARKLEPLAIITIDLMFRHGHDMATAWDLITPEG
ncbi:MAG: NAD(P)-binding domain-containing protein [Sphingomonadaceae bacterium]